MLTDGTIRRAPKVLLHDHLDGGLRPTTIVDLAAEFGYDGLPDDRSDRPRGLDPAGRRPQVARAVPRDVRPHGRGPPGARRDHPRGRRVRRGPRRRRRRLRRGALRARAVDRARPDARRGRRRRTSRVSGSGMERAAAAGRPIVMKMLVTAMRQAARSVEVAECAVRSAGRGRRRLRHRRPGDGLSARPATSTRSTSSATRTSTSRSTPARVSGCPRSGRRSSSCGAERLGHGVRIVDDITPEPDGSVRLGRLAAFVRDRRVPLEMCPTSNVHTGAVATPRRPPDRPVAPPPLPGDRRTPTTG